MFEIIPELQDLCGEPPRASIAPWTRLDAMFESADFSIPDANTFVKSDDNLVEISIENGRVIRKYASRS